VWVSLVSKRLIIVEDEPLIADMVELMATECGWETAGSASTEQEGHELLSTHCPDVAILNIKLGSTTSASIAAVCRERGIKIVYITGYDADSVAEEDAVRVLMKPFTQEDLAEALATAGAFNVAGSA
jgi:two-component SAPR family response regulator